MSKGIDRDRAVDESGHQIAVFNRVGSRPFTLAEMQRLYLREGRLYTVGDEPPGPPLGPPAEQKKDEAPKQDEPPPPPRIPLKFIGLMESGRAGKYAILTDGRGLPIYGKEGEVIEGRYRILRIGVESVDLAYLDGRGRQTIRQTGQ